MAPQCIIYNGYVGVVREIYGIDSNNESYICFTGSVEKREKDMPDIVFQGNTFEEAKANFFRCIDSYLEIKQQKENTADVGRSSTSGPDVSTVSGTSKIVKTHEKIFIAKRRGKTEATFNRQTENCICISDAERDEFFASCREYWGTEDTRYYLPVNSRLYELWSIFMREAYADTARHY